MEVKYRVGQVFMADNTYIDLYSVDGVKVWDVSVRHLYDDLRFDQHCSSGYASLTEDKLIGYLKKNDVVISEFLGG